VELKTEEPTPGNFYPEHTPAGRLERKMKAMKIEHIGELMYIYNKYPPTDQTRGVKMDMGEDERTLRTYIIRQIDNVAIGRLHSWENIHGLAHAVHIAKIVKEEIQPSQMEKHQWAALAAHNEKNRPIYEKEFIGLRVPPFFIFDCTFDGIEYHHAWDNSVWIHVLALPGGNSLADQVDRIAP